MIKIEDKNLSLPAIYHPGKPLGIYDVSHFIDHYKEPIETTIIPAVTDNLVSETTDAILVNENPTNPSRTHVEILPEQCPLPPYTDVGKSGIQTPVGDETFTNNSIATMLQDKVVEMDGQKKI
jgi:hypothetical protein